MIVEKNHQFENDFTTITTLEQAIRAANELERLQAMVDHLKEELKKFVETNGSFSTDTKTYYIQETVTYKFPQENIHKIAQALTIEGKKTAFYFGGFFTYFHFLTVQILFFYVPQEFSVPTLYTRSIPR